MLFFCFLGDERSRADVAIPGQENARCGECKMERHVQEKPTLVN